MSKEEHAVKEAKSCHQNDDHESSRGNLYFDCLWAVVTIAIVVFLACIGYDVLCDHLTCLSPETEKAIPFTYIHFGRVVTVAGVVFASLAVYVSVRVNETVHLHSFNLKYGDKETHKAIDTIADVGRRWDRLVAEGNDDFAPIVTTRSDKYNPKGKNDGWLKIVNREKLIDDNNRHLPWTQEEDVARRQLKNYFSSALELYRCHSISKRAFRNICDKDAITLFFKVIEPMESLINEDYHYRVFYETMKAAKKEYKEHLKLTAAHDNRKKYFIAGEKDFRWIAKGMASTDASVAEVSKEQSVPKPKSVMDVSQDDSGKTIPSPESPNE